MRKQIMIIGGGASGLAAAISAADAGAAVTILERLPRVGKKILLTGNGRCNLGNSVRDFSHYHGTLPQAKQILQQFDTEAFFRRMGLFIRTDSEGRRYPCSNTAASVLDALRMQCEQNGVNIRTEEQLLDLQPQKNGTWRLTTNHAQYTADAVILAAGGSASPACGTDGNLLPLLAKLGHKIQKPLPALCPILSDAPCLKSLKGMRVRGTASALVDGSLRKTECGEIQFTENALSGICLFNLSRLAAIYGDRMTVSLNILPDELSAQPHFLQELLAVRGNLPAGDLLTGILPKRVAELCIKQALGKCSETANTLLHSKAQQDALLHLLCDWRFPVKGTAPFSQAQVTAGGVSGQSITQNLMSKQHRGLFFCGEILDIDGDCGGYNLDWAWASGTWAGRCAVKT